MAYNMVMAIISCTQQQAQFYTVFLFKEDPGKVSMRGKCIEIVTLGVNALNMKSS